MYNDQLQKKQPEHLEAAEKAALEMYDKFGDDFANEMILRMKQTIVRVRLERAKEYIGQGDELHAKAKKLESLAKELETT